MSGEGWRWDWKRLLYVKPTVYGCRNGREKQGENLGFCNGDVVVRIKWVDEMNNKANKKKEKKTIFNTILKREKSVWKSIESWLLCEENEY